MIHIITHTDLDGYSAAYNIMQHFGENNCDVKHYNYDKPIDKSEFKNGDTVFITDYSLQNDEYTEIMNIVGKDNLIWCDHHITAINRYDPTLDLKGLRSTKYCGAALVWIYLNTHYSEEQLETVDVELPYWLSLVDIWDCWKTNSIYRKKAEYLNMGIVNDLCIDHIKGISNDEDTLNYYITKGEIYTEYRDSWANNFHDKYGFTRKLSGWLFNCQRELDISVLNIGCASSKYFGEDIDKYDVCITQCFNGEKWTVSFYSQKDDVDCSYAAKLFGGGGHKGAAGCTFDQLQPPISVKAEI